jgi:RND family efflux transporter MFP subunit
MRRITGITIAAVAFICAAGGAGFPQGMPPTPVETEPVRKMSFHDQIILVGRSEARARSRIVSEVSGRVLRIDAPEGNPVAAGDVLVTIDARSMEYSLEAKRAEVEQARAQADLAEKDLERSLNLFRQGLISDGELDADRAAATRALAVHRQRLAERGQLELDLENSRIRAPYDGYTVQKRIDVGEWVNPGTPVYEMVDLGTIRVIVDLPEKYFGRVAPGSGVSIVLTGPDGREVTGTITGIAPSAGEETHTFPVIVTVENPDGLLGAGMLVRATLPLDETFTSLSVPKDAILRQGTQTMVYTVADGKAVPIPVRERSTSGDRVAVEGPGLVEGMPVVVRGNERIFPGSDVRVGNGPRAAPAGGAEAGAPPEGGAAGEATTGGGRS